MMQIHRFLNFNKADSARRELIKKGFIVSQIARDTSTGGYTFATQNSR